jgi:hypothetical protein
MKNEFKRFKIEKLGLLTIVLEILGALGLLVGFMFETLLLISASGLALLMLIALLVRIKSKDSILASLPAIFFMVLNTYIAYLTIK